MRAPRRQAGFTLLELMIVVGMAALVLTISVPFVQRTLRQDAAYTAVKAFQDALQNARTLAILSGRPAGLVVLPHQRALRVELEPDPRAAAAAAAAEAGAALPAVDGAAAPARPAYQPPPPFAAQLADDVVFELLDVNFEERKDAEAGARVRFFPNGTSDEFTVVFRVGPQQWRKLSLDVVTGTPTLEVLR
jgi:prepilin-type N-terminal cleavage/methylation domain-containing protein